MLDEENIDIGLTTAPATESDHICISTEDIDALISSIKARIQEHGTISQGNHKTHELVVALRMKLEKIIDNIAIAKQSADTLVEELARVNTELSRDDSNLELRISIVEQLKKVVDSCRKLEGTDKVRDTATLVIDNISAREDIAGDRKSTRLNSSHVSQSRMPSSA